MRTVLLLLVVVVAIVDSATLLAITDYFTAANQMVTIDSATGTMTTVVANYSTWSVPDAAFDSKHNIVYTCTLIRPTAEKLEIVAYNQVSLLFYPYP